MRRFSARFTCAVLGLVAVAHSAARDGATALQQNYRTLLDNDEMQVVRVHYDPHQELAAHDHSRYPTGYQRHRTKPHA
jgi:quercetin dioxygenase-like cupin family protein